MPEERREAVAGCRFFLDSRRACLGSYASSGTWNARGPQDRATARASPLRSATSWWTRRCWRETCDHIPADWPSAGSSAPDAPPRPPRPAAHRHRHLRRPAPPRPRRHPVPSTSPTQPTHHPQQPRPLPQHAQLARGIQHRVLGLRLGTSSSAERSAIRRLTSTDASSMSSVTPSIIPWSRSISALTTDVT